MSGKTSTNRSAFGVVQRGPSHFIVHRVSAGGQHREILVVTSSAKLALEVYRRLRDRPPTRRGRHG